MKKIAIFCWLLFGANSFAQKISSKLWKDMFSFNKILVIREDSEKLVVASENGLFYINPSNNEVLGKLTKANGLHNVGITAFDYNSSTKIGLIGYEDGSIDVISPDGVYFIVDIPINKNINNKRINHISITGNEAVISTAYGLSIFKLDKREFWDTVFFEGGIKEAIINNNSVYAINNTGIIQYNNIDFSKLNPNFSIANEWTNYASGEFNNIDTDANIFAYSNKNEVWINNKRLPIEFKNIKDISINGNNIIVNDEEIPAPTDTNTYTSNVKVFNTSGQEVTEKAFKEPVICAWFHNNNIYAGTKLSGVSNDINSEVTKGTKPDGPFANIAYKLDLKDGKILVATGQRDGSTNEPINNTDIYPGFYYYDSNKWQYSNYFIDNFFTSSNSKKMFNILDVVFNPAESNEVLFTNYTQHYQTYTKAPEQGYYKVNLSSIDNAPALHELSTDKSQNRPVGFAFDEKNNFYLSLSNFQKKQSIGYLVSDGNSDVSSKRFDDPDNIRNTQKPLYKDGLLWFYCSANTTALYAVDTKVNPLNTANHTYYTLNEQNNLPKDSYGIWSFAIDNNGDAWIGTRNGLRILPDAANAVKKNPQTEPIVITQNGINEELFKNSTILQIEVDGSNRKWVSVQGDGVYLISPNGEKQIQHFTKDNSPLPNNNITDIKVDKNSGKVYFACNQGIVSYQSDITETSSKFGNVLVYPNPVVYQTYKGNVKIKGLAEKTNIRITDSAGNLVHQAVVNGGIYEWNLNFKNKRVASGIYFVLMTNADGTDTATTKIAVVN